MRDHVLYFKVALGFPTHHRLLRIADPVTRDIAVTVWLTVLDYTRANELDGYCPRVLVEQQHRRDAIAELIRVGLLSAEEKNGEHWLILSRYSEFNDSSSAIAARKERKARNQRDKRERDRAVTCSPVTGDTQATSPATHRVTETETETETETDLNPPLTSFGIPPSGESTTKVQPKRKIGTRVPESSATDAEVQAFASHWEIDRQHPQWPTFLDYWRARAGQGGVKLDWGATWRNWVRKATDMPIAAPQWGRQRVFGSGTAQGSGPDPNSAEECARRRREEKAERLAEVRQRLAEQGLIAVAGGRS